MKPDPYDNTMEAALKRHLQAKWDLLVVVAKAIGIPKFVDRLAAILNGEKAGR